MGLLAGLLFVFFCGFNILESCQPSLATRLAPKHARGTALGVYNTLQSLGFFVGGALGGWLVHAHGPSGLFAWCAAAALLCVGSVIVLRFVTLNWNVRTHSVRPLSQEPARDSADEERGQPGPAQAD